MKKLNLKKHINLLTIIILVIIVVFVSTATFNNFINMNLSNPEAQDEDIKNDSFNFYNLTEKNFKTPEEAYRYAINNLNNVNEYKIYISNGNFKIDIISGLSFIGNLQYTLQKDINNNKHTCVAVLGDLNDFGSLIEYYDAIKLNDESLYFRNGSDYVDFGKKRVQDSVYFNGKHYSKVSRKYLNKNFNVNPGEIPFLINSNTIENKAISFNGYDYRVNFTVNPNLGCAPLFNIIYSLTTVDLDIKTSNFNLTCRIDRYGIMKYIDVDIKSIIKVDFPVVESIPITLNLNFKFMFDYSEESGKIIMPDFLRDNK